MPGLMRKVKVLKSDDTSGMDAAVLGRMRAGLGHEFEFQRRFEDARHHGARIQVGDLRRVEAGFGNRKAYRSTLCVAGAAPAGASAACATGLSARQQAKHATRASGRVLKRGMKNNPNGGVAGAV
jgi:hypothetical protein